MQKKLPFLLIGLVLGSQTLVCMNQKIKQTIIITALFRDFGPTRDHGKLLRNRNEQIYRLVADYPPDMLTKEALQKRRRQRKDRLVVVKRELESKQDKFENKIVSMLSGSIDCVERENCGISLRQEVDDMDEVSALQYLAATFAFGEDKLEIVRRARHMI